MIADRQVAPSVVMLLVAIVMSGIAAALVASPALWLVTPTVVALVLRAAMRDAPPRLAAARVDAPELPSPLRERVGLAFTQLPDGDARRLLLAIVNQARLLFGRADSRFDATEERRLCDHVAGLVDACCATAGDLARLDQFSSTTDGAAARADLMARLAKARDLFRGRLTSAAEALAELYTSNVERGTPSTDRVAELTAEISADAMARAAATAEMADLLGQGDRA